MNLKKSLKMVKNVFKEVFRKPSYIIISVAVFLAMVIINIGSVNYKYFFTFPPLKLVVMVFFGTFSSMYLYSIILMIISSLLAGILVSLIVYQIKKLKRIEKGEVIGSSGILVSTLAPACASCGIGLITLLGLTGFLVSLPFGGTEVVLLGIGLLIYAIFMVSRKIMSSYCKKKGIMFSLKRKIVRRISK